MCVVCVNEQELKRPRENVEQVMEIILVKGNKGGLLSTVMSS